MHSASTNCLPCLSFLFSHPSNHFALSYPRDGTSLTMSMTAKKEKNERNATENITVQKGNAFHFIHAKFSYEYITLSEIRYCIYLWLPVGVAVTLHVHVSFWWWRGAGGFGGLVLGSEAVVDWVKWTETTIWCAFTWSSCFPYFPFVCSPGSRPVWEEWCDAAQNTQFSITSTIITVINSSNISS